MRALATWQDKCIDSQLLVASLVMLFKQRELDTDKLLRGTGIFIGDIRKPDHLISPKQLSRLLDNALSLWPSGDLSFLLGQRWLPSQSGALTAAMFCAQDLQALSRVWHKYHWLTQPWLQTWCCQGEHEWHYLLSLDLGMQRHRQFLIELSLSSLTAACKQLLGQAWRGSLCFPYRAPDNLAHYYKYFGTDLSFDAPLCRISMTKAQLRQPSLFALQSAAYALSTGEEWDDNLIHNGVIHDESHHHGASHSVGDSPAMAYQATASQPIGTQTTASQTVVSRQNRLDQAPNIMSVPDIAPAPNMTLAARQALLTHEFRLGLAGGIRLKLMRSTLSLPEMAQSLEMSPATLKRRLTEMGLSYGQLADETRLIRALYFLAEPEQDAHTIANSLSFSDASNFRRSFKRWTGQLPAYFRFWLA
ncbi:AraC family transcriptional regulator ligand-binding domain-containing protein [Shewanella seohaensis]|uniref:AraC family transcriptional regulator ligand-binding domain-containing protein n=1 Tax=Shewanella seohaensis TaxID=755175 RepID=A0ABV4VVL6_9GAMM